MARKGVNELKALILKLDWTSESKWIRETARIAEQGIGRELKKFKKSSVVESLTDMADTSQAIQRLEYYLDLRRLEHGCSFAVRGSMLIMAYGLMENILKLACDFFDKSEFAWPNLRQRVDVETRDLKGEYSFEPFVKYLSKIVGINLPSFFDVEAKLIALLRNSFAHQNGRVPKSTRSTIENLCKRLSKKSHMKTRDIEFMRDHWDKKVFVIVLGEDFVNHLLKSISEMFEKLFERIIEI